MFARSFIILICLSLPLFGEGDGTPRWFYRAWQTEDGLPDNSVSEISQSPDGYLWVATNGGALRFNGNDFSPLPLHSIPKLPSRQVHSMFIDQDGRVWLGMERGPIIRINKKSHRLFDQTDGIFKTKTTGITQAPNGRIWVSFSRGICYLDGDRVTRLNPKESNIPAAQNNGLVCTSDGKVWMSSGPTLGQIVEGQLKKIKTFPSAPIKIAAARESGLWLTHQSTLYRFQTEKAKVVAKLPDTLTVTALTEDRLGAVWIGSEKNGLFRVFENHIEEIPTSHQRISCVTEDREGNIWVGTKGGGLNLILPQSVSFIAPLNGLPFSSVRSTATDSVGRIWATSFEGQLGYREGKTWHLLESLPEGIHANCVTVDQSDHLWLGTQNHGLLRIKDQKLQPFEGQNFFTQKTIRSLLPARDGGLWIASTKPDTLHLLKDGTISKPAQPFEFTPIRALAESADGTIWMGTSDGHLLRVDGDRLIDESDIDGSINRSIRTLHSTPDGSLWIGYAGDGLGHLKNGTYRRFTTTQGLHDDYLSQIEHDDHGSLWIASNRGLFQTRLDNLLSESRHLYCQFYGRNNGLPSIQPSRDYAPSSSRGNDGSLYFSTHNGLLEVSPNEAQGEANPPRVLLENITISDQLVATFKARSMISVEVDDQTADLSDPNPAISLPPDHDNLTISFSPLNFATPENTLIRYKLSPVDEKWQVIDNQRRVTFPRLPAGEYQFQVIASTGSGTWSRNSSTLDIIVKPFFWETWWFKFAIATLTALIAGGLVFLSLKRRHQNQLRTLATREALEQERSRIARDIHDDLGASLTRISLLSQTRSADQKTQAPLDQIQATTRNLMRSMDGVVWAISPEHDEFDDLANYLSSYAQEFLSVAGIRCRLSLPVDLPDRQLSAQLRHNLLLAFKEALNNIVKYADATEVRVSLEPEPRLFSLKVQDDGSGINPETPADPDRPTAGNGMANMKERMTEIGGSCQFKSSPEEGTLIDFRVPYSIET